MVKVRSKEPIIPVDRGNIDISRRPIVQTSKGSATIYSTDLREGNKTVLIPMIAETDDGRGRAMGYNEAVLYYQKTGKHLGKFNTDADATKYGMWLHNEEQRRLNKRNMKDIRR